MSLILGSIKEKLQMLEGRKKENTFVDENCCFAEQARTSSFKMQRIENFPGLFQPDGKHKLYLSII